MKKLLASVLAATLLGTVAITASCGRDEESGITNRPLDQTKTILTVGNYNGGYGSEWLYKYIEEFEKQNANVSFEDGKMGIQIDLTENKDDMHGSKFANKMPSQDVIFTEAVYYYDFINRDYMYPITDVVKAVGADGKTIESKLTDGQKAFLDYEGNYYAIPHYAGFTGIIYNVDLFEEENFYYAKNGGFVKSPTDEKSYGPDGKTGTVGGVNYSLDDGLPATFDEFFALCDQMLKKGVTPFVWTGKTRSSYINWLLQALLTDIEGEEQTALNTTFRGTAKNLIDVSDDGTVTLRGDVEITPSNGYELFSQSGRYYALQFLSKMLSNVNYYHKDSMGDTFTNTEAQSAFLLDGYESSSYNKIAMMPEGIWWEEEANDKFAYAEKNIDESLGRKSRKFALMSLPNPTSATTKDKSTVIDLNKAYAFINGGIASAKVKAAKAFLAFSYTDDNLRLFTTITNTPKMLSYDITSEDYNSLTYFGKNVWDTYKNSGLVLPVSTERLYLDNQQTFDIYRNFRTATESVAVDAFDTTRQKGAILPQKFFNDTKAMFNESYWNANFGKYFNS